jgi:RNA polymerase sigma-70 factor (ECF subfamily)
VETSEESIGLETTATLLARTRAGDSSARDHLLKRYLPVLRRWAHGRLPAPARDLCDTDDLVQVTLLRAFDHMNAFEPRREGAFMAYLRQILINKVRDEIRRASRGPGIDPIDGDLTQTGPSPLERAIGRELLESYEAALAKLPESQREATVLRIEMRFTHQQVADGLGLPSADAARMLVARALVKLAEVMDEQAGR